MRRGSGGTPRGRGEGVISFFNLTRELKELAFSSGEGGGDELARGDESRKSPTAFPTPAIDSYSYMRVK